MTANPPVAIIGGGIGGLAASLALRNAGMPTQVFERGRRFGELGVAVGITPNGFTALATLGRGIAERVRQRGRPLAADAIFPIRLATGRVIGANWYGRQQQRPFVNIRRADLHGILLDAHGPDGLNVDSELVRFVDAAAHVAAHLADGRHPTAGLLVGADGLNSAVRGQLFGNHPPRYIATTLRGSGRVVLPDDLAGGSLTIGAGLSLFSLPLPGASTYHWTAVIKTQDGTWPRGPAASRTALLECLADWPFPCPELVAATAEEALVAGKMYDRPPLTTWSRGRATLLGDAAHPMNNSLGQGANTALEDAVVLGQCLVNSRDVVTGLRDYEAHRIPRTTRIVLRSAEISEHGPSRPNIGRAGDFEDWLHGWTPA